jgi:A/G-specific adenine glycosylase
VVQSYGSQLPNEKHILQQLPGFGPYTTNAVLSLAFNQPYAVVDGNIKRVISRLFAVGDDMRKAAGQKKIQALMDELLPRKQSRLFNEAVMEIGALICLPVDPRCQKCPLSPECLANQTAMQGQLPYLSKKAKVPKIRSLAFIVQNGDHLLVVKRPPKGMLAGLWEFPALKLDNSKADVILPEQLLLQNFGLQASLKKIWEPINHSYTHFHLNLQAVLLTTTKKRIRTNSYHAYRWLLLNELKRYPLHRAVWKIIDRIEADLIAVAN